MAIEAGFASGKSPGCVTPGWVRLVWARWRIRGRIAVSGAVRLFFCVKVGFVSSGVLDAALFGYQRTGDVSSPCERSRQVFRKDVRIGNGDRIIRLFHEELATEHTEGTEIRTKG